jgi:hypothetical protein
MDPKPKKTLLGRIPKSVIVLGALATIAGSLTWIYYSEFSSPEVNAPLHEAIGIMLAEETRQHVGPQGKIVVITMDTRQAPELKVQIAAFAKHLNTPGGCTITDKVVLDPGDNPKFRPGSGLSAKRFLKIASSLKPIHRKN